MSYRNLLVAVVTGCKRLAFLWIVRSGLGNKRRRTSRFSLINSKELEVKIALRCFTRLLSVTTSHHFHHGSVHILPAREMQVWRYASGILSKLLGEFALTIHEIDVKMSTQVVKLLVAIGLAFCRPAEVMGLEVGNCFVLFAC